MLIAVYAVVVCLSVCVCVCVCVCVSVSLRYCMKTAKRRITQITPHDSPLILVFWHLVCSAIGLWSIFTARCYACSRRYLSVRLSVCACVSVTLRYCVKTAKRRITQIMPHDRPGTLIFKWDVLYRSCRISTDKRVARSLCHSRASCLLSSLLDLLLLFSSLLFHPIFQHLVPSPLNLEACSSTAN